MKKYETDFLIIGAAFQAIEARNVDTKPARRDLLTRTAEVLGNMLRDAGFEVSYVNRHANANAWGIDASKDGITIKDAIWIYAQPSVKFPLRVSLVDDRRSIERCPRGQEAFKRIVRKLQECLEARQTSARAHAEAEAMERAAQERLAADFAGFQMPVKYIVEHDLGNAVKPGTYSISFKDGWHTAELPGFQHVDAQAVKDLITAMREVRAAFELRDHGRQERAALQPEEVD